MERHSVRLLPGGIDICESGCVHCILLLGVGARIHLRHRQHDLHELNHDYLKLSQFIYLNGADL